MRRSYSRLPAADFRQPPSLGRASIGRKTRQERPMKQFKCGDVVLGCEWVTRSEDENELFEEIASHAREAHGMDEVPPEVVEEIQGVITEV
jgi:predicted small metal-binding protein